MQTSQMQMVVGAPRAVMDALQLLLSIGEKSNEACVVRNDVQKQRLVCDS